LRKLANGRFLETRDYQEHKIIRNDGTVAETELPTSNVLYYDLSNDAWCAIRPSGTEPKIKLYMGVKGSSEEEATAMVEELAQLMQDKVNQCKD